MATVRDLERYLTTRNFSSAKLDAALRDLRAAKRLSVAGRGRSAAQISVDEVALILIGYAGSLKANDVSRRLKLLEATENAEGVSLHQRVCDVLNGVVDVEEMLISRTQIHARAILADGTMEQFRRPKREKKPPSGRFQAVGILDQRLLKAIAYILKGNELVKGDAPEPDEEN